MVVAVDMNDYMIRCIEEEEEEGDEEHYHTQVRALESILTLLVPQGLAQLMILLLHLLLPIRCH